VSGGNGTNIVRAVRTTIEWMNSSNVCSSGASYSVSIVNGSGWVQVGWRYYSGYANPEGYCEVNPLPGGSGTYRLREYTVPHSEQLYSFRRNTTDQFECSFAGAGKESPSTAYLGFSNGTWVPVQAEAHANHVQLGRIAPSWLEFTNSEKVLTGGGASAWTQMNVLGVHSDSIVWNFSQPVNDGFKVSTNASH
jgi:hypothetical protein